MSDQQTGERPVAFRVAIVGSGPSGLYAADALLKLGVHVDVFDRLPTPYGLVRGGVAPDHQQIKNVIKAYEKTCTNPNFRYFGNVALGRDVQVTDFANLYDQWIYAFGAEQDRQLGIPGEDLQGSHSATELVGWYNGHPDHVHRTFDLSCERVAVVGIGNVAMDVTRILVQNPDELAATDIDERALQALRQSNIKEVVLLGRRGVVQAAFSPAEIEEIGELQSADVLCRPDEVGTDGSTEAELQNANVKKNVDFCIAASQRTGTKGRTVHLRFLASPVELIGENGKVTAIRIERNRLEGPPGAVSAKGTGVFETIPVGLVFRSVGYKGIGVEGVPYDPKSGTVPNQEGRVHDHGALRPREYVVGWAKRGPSGLIGTNRGDSHGVVAKMNDDRANLTPLGTSPDAILELLRSRNVRWTTFADWKKIDAYEQAEGKARGKVRAKVTSVPAMLEVIGQ